MMTFEVKIVAETGGTASLANPAELLCWLVSRLFFAARLCANKIAVAEFEILAGGYFLHMDNPCGLRRSIRAFLSRTSHRVGVTSLQKIEAYYET